MSELMVEFSEYFKRVMAVGPWPFGRMNYFKLVRLVKFSILNSQFTHSQFSIHTFSILNSMNCLSYRIILLLIFTIKKQSILTRETISKHFCVNSVPFLLRFFFSLSSSPQQSTISQCSDLNSIIFMQFNFSIIIKHQ